jgi:hypothetical protein
VFEQRELLGLDSWYGLNDGFVVRFLAEARRFSILQDVQNILGTRLFNEY